MLQSSLYLGESCPPNMEAYLDSLLYRTNNESFDLITVADCDLPRWIEEEYRLNIIRFSAPTRSGFGRTKTAYSIVRRYISTQKPTEIRQITQPRWHALGVLLGARGRDVRICSRVSTSMLTEFRQAPSEITAWLANNVLGRSAFFADKVFTPQHGGVDLPWWSAAELVREPRIVNKNRFTPSVEPMSNVFKGTNNRVLTVGRISQRKGIDLLLDVADMLVNWEFTVVGPVESEALLAEIRQRNNIRHQEPVNYVDMPSLYAACDIVLSVSRLEWGGVSRAMLEGKAMDKRVIALDREHAYSVADYTVSEDPSEIAKVVASCVD